MVHIFRALHIPVCLIPTGADFAGQSKTISEEFWAILSYHDPDIFFRYQPTGADCKARAPQEFEKLVSAEVTKRCAESGLEQSAARGQMEKAVLEANFDEWVIRWSARRPGQPPAAQAAAAGSGAA